MPLPLPLPVTMVGAIDRCALLTYRTPADAVHRFLPAGLRLRTVAGFAFWNVVLCHVRRMRPRATPATLGLDYHHVAYRLLVEATTPHDNAITGLYFVRSDADSTLIRWGGATLSDFRFHPARVELRDEPISDSERATPPERPHDADPRHITALVNSRDGLADAELDASTIDRDRQTLAPGSPFESIEHARTFLKYNPLGVAPNRNAKRLRLAEVFRNENDWREQPLRVKRERFTFFEHHDQPHVQLELATRVAPIDYRWRLGNTRPINPSDAPAAPHTPS